MEEVDKDKEWQGRLAAKFFLRDEMEDRLLWKHRFDVRRSAAKPEVKSVVEGLNRIYNDEMDAAMSSLRAFLDSGGCRTREADPPRSFLRDDNDKDERRESEALTEAEIEETGETEEK